MCFIKKRAKPRDTMISRYHGLHERFFPHHNQQIDIAMAINLFASCETADQINRADSAAPLQIQHRSANRGFSQKAVEPGKRRKVSDSEAIGDTIEEIALEGPLCVHAGKIV
jgi:hypothetical protein